MSPDTLLEVLGLKALDRTGWVRRGVPEPESVAAHTWGVCWLVLVFLPEDLDRGRALTYATLHDLAEVRVGDLAPSDGVPHAEKHRRERAAIRVLLAERPHLEAAWNAYEAQQDPEARFVRQLDRLDMALQAVRYAREGTPELAEFLDSARSDIESQALIRVLDELRRRMDKMNH